MSATTTSPAAPAPVTVRDLKLSGRRLQAYCMECGHERPLDLCRVALPEAMTAAEAGSRLKCSACGSRRIYTRPEPPTEDAGHG